MEWLELKAEIFAISAHSALGQVRKYSGEPYHVHCCEVRDLVSLSHTSTVDMKAAALLHDVVEDTYISTQILVAHFNEVVAGYVSDLTDFYTKANFPDMGRKERKLREAERLGNCCPSSQTIKVADLISNSRNILKYNDSFGQVYIPEKRHLLSCLTLADPVLIDIGYLY